MSPVQTMGVVAYRAAVQLYPAEFRREFGPEMTRDFVQAMRDAANEHARGSVLRLWAHVGADFLCSLILQWIRTGMPVALLIAGGFSFGGIALIASFMAVRPSALVPPPTIDAEMVALFLIAIGLLLVIASTICVTLWITRSFLRRSRT